MNIGQIGPQFLLALKHQPLQWSTVLGELCDNAFDAGANRVRITFGAKKMLTVADDGNGCDNVERMLTIGDHYRQPTTGLGRWGVGLKEAACWLWGELRLKTTYKGHTRKACIDWNSLSRQSSWEVPDPTTSEAIDHRGTELIFRNIVKGYPDFERLRHELSYIFAPALWFGKQIVFDFARRQPQICSAWQIPDLEEMVQDRFEINGKRVHLKAGIVAMGAINDRKGFSFSHRHRIICNSAMGSCGRSVARICGIVELDRGWKLSKNKTAIVDSDEKLLEEAIYARCQELLDKADKQSQLLLNSELENKISESLRSLLESKAKAKRHSPEHSTGSVEPKNSDRKVRRAKNIQPGDKLLDQCDIGSIRMEWESMYTDSIGRVDLPGNIVYLNSNHARLMHHRDTENIDALVDQCMSLFAYEVIESEQRDKFPSFRHFDTFFDALAQILNKQQSTDDARKSILK